MHQAAIERILANNSIVEIIQKIRELTPEQIETIRETMPLLQAQKELVAALVDQQVAAKLGNAQAKDVPARNAPLKLHLPPFRETSLSFPIYYVRYHQPGSHL